MIGMETDNDHDDRRSGTRSRSLHRRSLLALTTEDHLRCPSDSFNVLSMKGQFGDCRRYSWDTPVQICVHVPGKFPTKARPWLVTHACFAHSSLSISSQRSAS